MSPYTNSLQNHILSPIIYIREIVHSSTARCIDNMKKYVRGNNIKIPMPREAAIIVTYRCPMKCTMCQIHDFPSEKTMEIKPAECEKLPKLKFINITGGEPFIREDLEEFIARLIRKADRIVVSTSGWYVERVIELAEKYPQVGFRISLEGLSRVNDTLRGRKGSFDRGLNVLLELRRMGIKDIGFGITISDMNAEEMLWLYELAKTMNMEFATAAVHNSFYFHTYTNRFNDPEKVCRCLRELVRRLLQEKKAKSWFRAFFNCGLLHYVRGKPRLLPCEAGTLTFFLDPAGEVYPCNGCEPEYWLASMGNIRTSSSFKELWQSKQAEEVRKKVSSCVKNCWMIGTVSPVMKKYIRYPLAWVILNKLRSIMGKMPCIDNIEPYSVKKKNTCSENPVPGGIE
jgi:radical SAM protein with 4Fe4S-binding SPASM domain